MDRMELGDVGSGCEDENCGLASGLPEDCINQECPVFGLIELVCVTVIYIPLMIFGLLGNILTILVVWLRPQMRSSTYLYLSSMAVSDLLILLLLPLDLYKLWRPSPWPLGDLACKLSMFLSECCTFCTILHITFLSLERYLAVCWPITAKTLVTRRKTRALIGCLWFGAAISAAPVFIMVGVEEVGGKEKGISGWREDRWWTGGEGEQGSFIMGGGKSGRMDGELEVIKQDENETKGWSEGVGEFGEKEMIRDERKEKPWADKSVDEKQLDEHGDEDEANVQVYGKKQNKMKEDEEEEEEREEDIYGDYRSDTDKRECRCLDYAATSGLLSAMTILSNLYFLIPLCILGLVYSLIGRTLWLRPQSSRKDQSHRHTVKMLGVIVLAFVLCWLPFHVGRTIFSMSFSTNTDLQEMDIDMDTTSNLDTDMFSDVTDLNIHTVTKPIGHSDTRIETISKPAAPALTGGCDTCVKTKVKINTNINVHTQFAETGINTDTHTKSDKSTDRHIYSQIISQTRGQHISTDTLNLDLSTKTDTHTERHIDPTHDMTELDRLTDDINQIQNIPYISINNKQNRTSFLNKTNTCRPYAASTYAATPSNLFSDNTHNDTHFMGPYADADKQVFFYYLSQYFNLVSSILFYLSAAVNPLLYNLMSVRYRHAVHSLIHTQSHQLRTTLTARHSTTTL